MLVNGALGASFEVWRTEHIICYQDHHKWVVCLCVCLHISRFSWDVSMDLMPKMIAQPMEHLWKYTCQNMEYRTLILGTFCVTEMLPIPVVTALVVGCFRPIERASSSQLYYIHEIHVHTFLLHKIWLEIVWGAVGTGQLLVYKYVYVLYHHQTLWSALRRPSSLWPSVRLLITHRHTASGAVCVCVYVLYECGVYVCTVDFRSRNALTLHEITNDGRLWELAAGSSRRVKWRRGRAACEPWWEFHSKTFIIRPIILRREPFRIKQILTLYSARLPFVRSTGLQNPLRGRVYA